jgi:hypothetical protein
VLWTLPSHADDANEPDGGAAVARLLEQMASVRSQLRRYSQSRNPVTLIRIAISDEHPTHALQREVRIGLRQEDMRPLTAQCESEIKQLVAILLQVKRECSQTAAAAAGAITHGSSSVSIRALRQKEAQASEGGSSCSASSMVQLGELRAGHLIADVRYQFYLRVDMPPPSPLPLPLPLPIGQHKKASAVAPLAVTKSADGPGETAQCHSSSSTVKVEGAAEIAVVRVLAASRKRSAEALHSRGVAAGGPKRARADRR